MIYYQLKCKDLGFNYCDFTAMGNSESELMRKFFFHTVDNHEKDYESLEDVQKIAINDRIKQILEKQN